MRYVTSAHGPVCRVRWNNNVHICTCSSKGGEHILTARGCEAAVRCQFIAASVDPSIIVSVRTSSTTASQSRTPDADDTAVSATAVWRRRPQADIVFHMSIDTGDGVFDRCAPNFDS